MNFHWKTCPFKLSTVESSRRHRKKKTIIKNVTTQMTEMEYKARGDEWRR